MFRKSVGLLTLAAFLIFSASCKTWGLKDVATMERHLPENSAVRRVVNNSGEVIQFSLSNPGRVRGYTIVGTAKDPVPKRVDLTGPFRSIKKRSDGTIYEVVDAKGQVYFVQQVVVQGDNQMAVMAAEWVQVSVPLSEARTIEIKKSNSLLTTLAVIGGLAGGMFITLALTLGISD